MNSSEPRLDALGPIATARLDLRRLTLADAEPFRATTDEPAIFGAVDFLGRPLALVEAERLIIGDGDGRDGFWGLWPREDPILIGTVGTHLRGDREIEIGYWLASARQGRGLAREAVAAVLQELAAGFPGRSVYAECRPENAASWRLLSRLGFRPDGRDGRRAGRTRLRLG